MALLWLVAGFALLSQGCAPDEPDEPPVVGTCVRSFGAVLEEWKVYVPDRLPVHCEHLDSAYDVQLVAFADMALGPARARRR